jgi:LysM repeat protein
LSWRTLATGALLALIVSISLTGFSSLGTLVSWPGQASLVGGSSANSALGQGGVPSPPQAAIGPVPASVVSSGAAVSPAPASPAKPVAPAPASPAKPVSPAPASPAKPVAPAPASPAKPVAPAPAIVVGCFNYTVAPGDDLAALGERFGTTGEAIAEASNLDASQSLYPGMSLRVPTTDLAKVEERPLATAIPWLEINDQWAAGDLAQVTDVWTGRVFYVMRCGGWAHADVEPWSSRDTATMLANYEGEWSWSRRPIVVVIEGRRVAASQNGMPHGGSSRDNDFPGHFCIHFLGSTTHGSSYTVTGAPTLDPAHQRCVAEAVGH